MLIWGLPLRLTFSPTFPPHLLAGSDNGPGLAGTGGVLLPGRLAAAGCARRFPLKVSRMASGGDYSQKHVCIF